MRQLRQLIVLLLLWCCSPTLVVSLFEQGSCLEGEDVWCGEHGKCETGPVMNEKMTHWCRCDDGYGGSKCEKKCTLDCIAGKKCVFDVIGQPKCVCDDCDRHGNLVQSCPSGFGGVNCTDQGWCYSDKCMNGGKCHGNGAAAKCACPEGLTGPTCEEDVDECALNNKEFVCYNGKCENTFGSYICTCDDGFEPPNCLFIDERAKSVRTQVPPSCFVEFTKAKPNGVGQVCQNDGVCVKHGDNNATRCECPPGYDGAKCEITVDSCAKNPCQNGTCQNLRGGFQCICSYGHEGEYCEHNYDDCKDNECAAGSKCIDGIAKYTCECPPGKMGTFCEYDDPCAANPGLCNHGKCTPLPEDGTFSCNCDLGFRGELCDNDVDECRIHTKPCQNDGKCINTPGSYDCECPRGFNGTRCQNLVNTCESENVKCENGGSCAIGPDREPVCLCELGYIGRRCEKACADGFVGVRCDLMLSQPVCGVGVGRCLNGGVCQNGFCKCYPNFTGNQCELSRRDAKQYAVENSCQSDPCLNKATCINVVERIGYVCICPDGYEGDVCERRKDFCSPNPCFNGGTCEKHSYRYQCRCPPGYTGNHCEKVDMLDCSRNGCFNGGVCHNTATGGNRCECSYGFSGPRCEHTVDVGRFYDKDRLFREMCDKRNCSLRANDGSCDIDCNFAACDFDGGDCSGRQKPFAKCKYGSMCAHLFANGHCDQACNNEDCLYDGMDCMPKIARCPLIVREHCAARFADGECDTECNSDACGFDGGDCEAIRRNVSDIKMLSDIRVKILMPPQRFQKEGGEILMSISSAIRSVIRIQRDDGGLMVFEWDGEDSEGARVTMHNVEQKLIGSVRRRRDVEAKGVVVYLEVEEPCDLQKCLFTSSENVVSYISAEIAKNGQEAFGVPIYEAMVAHPKHGKTTPTSWSINQVLIFVIIAFVVLGTSAAGVMVMNGDEKRSRKRKVISAPEWIPPMESDDNGKRRSQNSLLGGGGYYDTKRQKIDVHQQQPWMYNDYSSGYVNRDMTLTQGGQRMMAEPIDPTPPMVMENFEPHPLHIQACSPGPITVPLDAINVNIPDRKYRRCVLHWLAASPFHSNEQEDCIVEDAKRCLDMGAEVDARDCDNNTPLMLAVKAKRSKMVIILLGKGANPTVFNNSERSALHEAAVNMDKRMIEILLTDKRMVNQIDELDRNGKTALMELAAMDKHLDSAKLLLSRGAKLEYDGADRKESEVYKGRTALHYAAATDNLTMVKFLVSQNANKDKQDENGQTPLMMAAKEGRLRTVAFLIAEGASLDTTDLLDKTAQQLAEQRHHFETATLISQGILLKETNEQLKRQQGMSSVRSNKSGAGAARPTLKAVKRNASRRGYQPPSSRESTLHMTPPQSDGSLSSPSPQHFLNISRTTPTNLHYPTSPTSHYMGQQQHQMMYPNGVGMTRAGSTGPTSDSSPEYQPQENVDFQSSCSTNTNMWYGASPPYQKMDPTGYAGLYEHKPMQQSSEYVQNGMNSQYQFY